MAGAKLICLDTRTAGTIPWEQIQKALNPGTQRRFVFETPLLWRGKAATWALADRLGGSKPVHIVVERIQTCYRAEQTRPQDWGYGCGTCTAWGLRAGGRGRWQTQRA